MRVLAILYCYPPLLVPAAICYAKLMAGLRANDVDVDIVTIAPDSFLSPAGPLPLDEGLAARLPELTNHEIWSPEKSPLYLLAKRLDPQRRLFARWLEPKKREWTVPALRHLRGLDLSKYDALLSCSQPHSNHLIGLQLQEEVGIPWIAYFSDPWTDNPYQLFPTEAVRRRHAEIESRVLARADRVLFTCEEMRRLVLANHAELDQSRSGVLPHAFVSSWYDEAAPTNGEAPRPRLHLLHTGSFYGPRTPAPLIESLGRIAGDIQGPQDFRIDLYGGMAQAHKDRIRNQGMDALFQTHGFIPYLDSLALMARHDGLLLVDAPLSSTDESVFLPSKLIDYLGARKPVIAVTPERGATARVVKESGGIVCPLERPEALDEVLLEAIRNGTVRNSLREDSIVQYSHESVGRALVKAVEEMLANAV